MKNFYKKYEDSIIIMINVMLIILGFITKKTIYSIIYNFQVFAPYYFPF